MIRGVLGKGIVWGAETSFKAATTMPFVGSHIAEFVLQESLVENLLDGEARKEAVLRAEEVGMLKKLGPEQEYNRKRAQLAQFVVEVWGNQEVVPLDASRHTMASIPTGVVPLRVSQELRPY
jgi:hypothetical protein